VVLDHLARDPSEPGGELRGGLVATLLREEGVTPDVSDQEGPDPRLSSAWLAFSRIAHSAAAAFRRFLLTAIIDCAEDAR
jgi:hypothetical protein